MGRPSTRSRGTLGVAAPTRYIERMQFVLPVMVVIAMLATLGTLLFGILNMAKGGNPQRSNKLMRMRIWLQGAALLLFVIFMMLYRR
jgi:hypothetical protein